MLSWNVFTRCPLSRPADLRGFLAVLMVLGGMQRLAAQEKDRALPLACRTIHS